MQTKIFNLVIFLMITSGAFALDYYYNISYSYQVFQTLAWLTGLYILFRFLIEEIGARRITDPKSRYSFRKTTGILFLFSFLIVIGRLWIENAQALLVSYGIIAAGLAVALQDIFKNFAGGIIILMRGMYRVGDRVQLGDKQGDVIDISILYTTLQEIRGWLDADQNTGRLTTVPNGFMLRESFENYTRNHSYVWDQIHLPIAYGCNWQKAEEIILAIVTEETKNIAKTAQSQIKRLRREYYIRKTEFDPHVFIKMTDNWISFYVRYASDARERARTRDHLSRKILLELERHEDIRLASETFEIVGVPPLKVVKR